VLADEINDAPATIALLQVLESESGNLGSPQAAAETNRENSSVTQSPECRDIRGAQERLRLRLRLPL
jgi:hypothetical protein